MACTGKGMSQGADDQAAHHGRFAKAHFGLGWMHIHIHEGGVQIDKQRRCRVAITGQIVGISRPQAAL